MTKALMAALAVLLITTAPAHANGATAVAHPDGLGPVETRADGLLEVETRTGRSLTTHGADRPAAARAGSTLPTRSRPPRCAPTDHNAVLYGRPAKAAARLEARRAHMEAAVSGANAALDEAALESGDRHADLRVRCDGAGRLRIDGFVNARSSSFADVVDAARAAGANDPGADYLIFYDDPAAETCGVATFIDDRRPTADNRSNSGGGFAVVYPDCWEARTVLHEIAHTQGAVQAGGPNATGAGHCRDEADVMCYADGSEGAAGLLQRCDTERFDCDYDDYFDARPEPGEVLASSWNLGSPLNRFIELSDIAPHEDPYGDPPAEDRAGKAVSVPRVRIAGRPGRPQRGRVAVKLKCPSARRPACRGTVEIRAGRRKVGARAFDVRAGRTRTVRVSVRTKTRRVRAVVDDPLAVRSAR